ncbi:hypothetical protein AG0111_0g2894 [Alternaria gaisen]|uniref:Uncharacterized protein n=1 Tax=Alternaria gaisen TaxID=167740 RepID=A0ACB6FY66_9PLEO|nr:hypothetical protein AA0111_g3056 [Alternaria arborescens]KAB2109290.1 hypothetical protein AG0111_0g2894 [Alternaria gaisen]RYO36140.1 hypothetical protein AA0111_g3056 [Alternaria arborescens]
MWSSNGLIRGKKSWATFEILGAPPEADVGFNMSHSLSNLTTVSSGL